MRRTAIRLGAVVSALFASGLSLDAAWSQALPLPSGTVLTGPVYRAKNFNPKCLNQSNPFVPAITTGAQANAYTCNDVLNPPGFYPSFELAAPAAMVVTSTPTQYVRVWCTDNTNGRCGYWGPNSYKGAFMAQPSAIRGMTPEQVAAALALPGIPNMITTMAVAKGDCVLSGIGGPAFGQPGGPQQFWLAGAPSGANCAGLNFAPDSTYVNRGFIGPYALAYAPFAGGGNAGAVAIALDRGPYAAPFTQMDEVYKSLDLLNYGVDPRPLRAALTQLDGEIYADYSSVAITAGQQILSAVMTEMRAPATSAAKPVQLWFSAIGGGLTLSGNGDSHELSSWLGGFTGGIEGRVNPALFAGLALGYETGWLGANGISGSGQASTFSVTPYARYAPGPWYVQGAIGYSYNWGSINRSMSFVNAEYYSSGVTFNTHGSPKGNAFLSQAETGYRFDVTGNTALTPFVGLQGIAYAGNSFTETGGGAVDLHVAGQTTNQWVSLLGGEVAYTPFAQSPFTLNARLAWAYDLSGPQRSATVWLDGTPSMAAFTVQGACAPRNAAFFSLGGSGRVAGFDVFARYEGAAGNGAYGQSATLGVRASF